MSRFTQVKKLKDPSALRAHLEQLGVDLAVAEAVDPDGALAAPGSFVDGPDERRIDFPNRFAVLPMEGWDGDLDGRPTDLVRRRWERFGASGAGLVWAEATAVRPDGRANPNQLVLGEHSVDEFAELRSLLAAHQVVGLQLTHSGRYSRPTAAGPKPQTAYEHPLLDQRVGASAASVLSDGQLDELIEDFVTAAHLAYRAGFDFIDVKACHGYLGHELLTAYDRPGRFGGALDGRLRFFRTIVERIRSEVPDLAVALRLSAFDVVPHVAGPDGAGQPEVDGPYRFAFGADETGTDVDLTETHALLEVVAQLGVGLVSITAGSPYYCPHVQRPAYFPPSDGYGPPEDPLVGVARLIAATRELREQHPGITFVGTGYSYLQDWLAHVGQAAVESNGVDLVGVGRMMLSYPSLPADVLGGRALDRRLICRTFSDCTTAPRSGLVSGCFPLDDFYKAHPQRVELAAAKKAVRAAKRAGPAEH